VLNEESKGYDQFFKYLTCVNIAPVDATKHTFTVVPLIFEKGHSQESAETCHENRENITTNTVHTEVYIFFARFFVIM